jgi:hypothetical protein
MGLVLLIGLPLGWKARKASLQRSAVAVIKQEGGDVLYKSESPFSHRPGWKTSVLTWLENTLGPEYFREIESVSLDSGWDPSARGPDASDRALASTEALGWVRKLRAQRPPVTNAGLKHVATMTRLETLELACAGVTDAGFDQLRSLRKLKYLEIEVVPGNAQPIDGDRFLANLEGFDQMGSLVLRNMEVRKASSFEALRGMSRLQNVWINGSPADPACLAYLAKADGLETLSLPRTRARDADLAWLATRSSLQTLEVDGSDVTDAGLGALGDARALRDLEFRGTLAKITDAGVTTLVRGHTAPAKLEAGPTLQELILPETTLTDASLASLATLPRLWNLGLPGSAITDAGVATFAKRVPKDGDMTMGLLDLSRTRITDRSLPILATFRFFNTLNLSGTAITDAGLAELNAGVPFVVYSLNLADTAISDQGVAGLGSNLGRFKLNLAGTRITDACLAAIATHNELEELSLSRTAITDAGLARLQTLYLLETLDVRGTAVTEAGIQPLFKILPNLVEVKRDTR